MTCRHAMVNFMKLVCRPGLMVGFVDTGMVCRYEKGMAKGDFPDLARPRIGVWLLLAVAIFAGVTAILFKVSLSYFESLELQRSQGRVTLYRSTLISALDRYQHLPYVLARDPYVIDAASGGDRDALNRRLADFSDQAALDAIYLMDRTGLTISASNYDQPQTFLGQNYGFRPYFRSAMQGNRGQFFGIGATTLRPGFFVAEPVRDETGQIRGVIALKLDLTGLETAWNRGGETVFVSNPDGVVVLSSDPAWRYRALERIPEPRRIAIRDGRQFGNEPLAALQWRTEGPDIAVLNGTRFLHVTAGIPAPKWTLHFLTDEREVLVQAWFSVIAATIVAALLLAIGLYIRARRIRTALQASQAARRKLRLANVELAREIEERRAAEQRLESARTELARASKLAALGQLAASVTHELGQPIAAMKNYLAAAEMAPQPDGQSRIFGRLTGIVARMERLTAQLRFFAQPSTDRFAPTDMVAVWRGAQELIAADARAAGVTVEETITKRPVPVHGDRMRLEQVFVNLVRNAILAMKDSETKVLSVTIADEGGTTRIAIADTGCGLGNASLEELQEPFVTSRASGDGMGLGLAISAEIVKEHGGSLAAQNRDGGGAEFSVCFPLIEEERAA